MGSLFLWGQGRSGELGFSYTGKCVRSPTAVDVGARVVDVACGEEHTLAVTEFGDVVSFGRNKEGQLGRTGDRVGGLEDEVCVRVACGAFHSVVATAAGRVYEFGLCHTGQDEAANEQEATTTAGAAPAQELRGVGRDAVRDRIVRESTERWLVADDVVAEIATSDADAELLARAGTFSSDERAAMIGLARMDCRRVPVRAPRLATSLASESIVEVACGYGHTLAKTRTGRVFASGYNDRGQLGLGHRVNLNRFERIKAIDRATVIAAGSQHSLLVSNGALYAFGQGSLGQLGLGRRVTGRLVPVPVTLGGAMTRTCAAGANHSIAVDDDGACWFWGHAEYGQHGGLGTGHDYVTAEYWYVPRPVTPAPPPLRDACCGANFSMGVSAAGALVSWGWPAHGVLGRGDERGSASPDFVHGLDGVEVLRVAAATRHAAAVATDARCLHGRRLAPLLSKGPHDVSLGVDGDDRRVGAHAAILAARSRYLRGLLRAADGEPIVFPATLGGARLTLALLRAVLVYVYTDRLDAPPHRLSQLAAIARDLGLPGLAALCEGTDKTSTFAAEFAALVDDKYASDLVLRLGDARVHAHRVLLETNDYFAALLRFHDKTLTEIDLADSGLAERELRDILKFVYAGQDALDLADPDRLFALVVAADLVRLPQLVRSCERALVLLIADDLDSARACLDFAHQFDFCTRLKRAARDVLTRAGEWDSSSSSSSSSS
ncbi:hypothetical protein CTAYLR_003854 [Chrysophaeum taylorii]|uniref:BTB domain-containing protein n=1 Tax=Chrysophaeum taylorii TaxID=2483200 RepID=A0AAD7XNV8_9STRA|nr:hypothetical protein CTAYLR_003854 [Chrysophaeum taylorii]